MLNQTIVVQLFLFQIKHCSFTNRLLKYIKCILYFVNSNIRLNRNNNNVCYRQEI